MGKEILEEKKDAQQLIYTEWVRNAKEKDKEGRRRAEIKWTRETEEKCEEGGEESTQGNT